MRRSSTRTLSILAYARSASSFSLNSTKAYCSESPVLASQMISQLMIVPNREKINSRSSLLVIWLSLQTKSTFSGGATSAKGRSPTISSVRACARASRARRTASIVSGSPDSSIDSSSPTRREASWAAVGTGEEGGTRRPGGSGKGSSACEDQLLFSSPRTRRSSPRTMTWRILISLSGFPWPSVNASLIFASVSSPSTTLPNGACFPSK